MIDYEPDNADPKDHPTGARWLGVVALLVVVAAATHLYVNAPAAPPEPPQVPDTMSYREGQRGPHDYGGGFMRRRTSELLMTQPGDESLDVEPGELPPLSQLLGEAAKRDAGYRRGGPGGSEQVSIWYAAAEDVETLVSFYNEAARTRGFTEAPQRRPRRRSVSRLYHRPTPEQGTGTEVLSIRITPQHRVAELEAQAQQPTYRVLLWLRTPPMPMQE